MSRFAEHLAPPARRAIACWLLLTAALVGLMTVIGGVTRLTDSGLSMVEWRPLVGWLPPASDAEWARVFALYQATPEYQKINAGMSIGAFKSIFWWEFVHRVWGRLIGLVFAAPLAFFWLKGWVRPPLRGRLLLLLALGGLQGFIGWWMVKSGLVDRPDVSHYRLAVHLAMAFVIAGLLATTALGVLAGTGATVAPAPKTLRRHSQILLAAIFAVVILGAFVAGLDAGMIYNTFPLMGGSLTPPDGYGSPLADMATIQFNHRWAAILTVIGCFWLWLRARDAGLARGQARAAAWLAVAAGIQLALGVATLLTVVWVPLAALHQAVALLLFLAAVWTVWAFRGQAAAA